MSNFVVTLWLMFGKVSARIEKPEFNATIKIWKRQIYAEILK